MDALEAFFQGELPLHQEADKASSAEVLGSRPAAAIELVRAVRRRWQWMLEHLDASVGDLPQAGADETVSAELAGTTVFRALQSHALRASWKNEVREPLMQVFDGRAFDPLRAEINAIHKRVLKSRLFVALHMHAGDGNVHTNIPVNSDDYAMRREADVARARITKLARSLDRVISGEHGIGITKFD